ncbi:LLM class flavin-dependent oxidoreductase [Gluconacetobacter azotocaptans]|uniref:LLM class flavin-dependent oxidoreductase n=3 Tax=Gluconacetobacter azotocaptans TaxID=142834 RepID=A0A7W4PDZ6_9PROT|nr:LLM class flavin-dependent oxidoreductase [Gluconacetobacter azotocaptans]
MSKRNDKIRLAAFNFSGMYSQGWRHPDVQSDGENDFDWQVTFARTAERGLFDMIFMADESSLARPISDRDMLSRLSSVAGFEPATLMAALAACTQHVGLVHTMSTTYEQPYYLARQLASIDKISKGRAGWNLVTSGNPNEAANFGVKGGTTLHADRYRRAAEFHHVVTGLWDSIEDDAFLLDKEGGRYLDPEKIHALAHEGEFFSVKGPLRGGRSPQGHPIIAQAGASGEGRDLGSRTADVVFCSTHFIEDAQAFYADMKQRTVAHGRQASDLKIFPGTSIVWGETQSQAEDRFDEISRLYPDEIALENITGAVQLDVSNYDLDGPFPDLPPTRGMQGHQRAISAFAKHNNLSIRQTAQRLASSSKHRVLVGTTQSIVDNLEEWFMGYAADGFVIMNPYRLRSLEDVVTHIVPELQRRGLFRTAYEGKTLRENLGLSRPESRFAATRAVRSPDVG